MYERHITAAVISTLPDAEILKSLLQFFEVANLRGIDSPIESFAVDDPDPEHDFRAITPPG